MDRLLAIAKKNATLREQLAQAQLAQALGRIQQPGRTRSSHGQSPAKDCADLSP